MAGLQYKRFKDAFRSARAAGDKEFEWEGKKYNTELAKDAPAKSDKADKEDPEMVRKAYQEAARLRAPKVDADEAERKRQRKLMDEPGLESVSPELDLLPIGKLAGAMGAGAAVLKGGEKAIKAVKAARAAKRAENAATSGAMKGEAAAGELRYKKGGSVASRRGDGIAMRGKTRGKIC